MGKAVGLIVVTLIVLVAALNLFYVDCEVMGGDTSLAGQR
jgi:hypothetical protein